MSRRASQRHLEHNWRYADNLSVEAAQMRGDHLGCGKAIADVNYSECWVERNGLKVRYELPQTIEELEEFWGIERSKR